MTTYSPAWLAWRRVYEFVTFRRQHYCLTFLTPNGKAVLKDLAKFCRANELTFNTDARIHALLDGRREVWLRIQQHLRMTPDELAEIYGHPEPEQLEQTK